MSDNNVQSTPENSYTKDFGRVYAKEVAYLKERRNEYVFPPVRQLAGNGKEEKLCLPEEKKSLLPEMDHGTIGLAFSGGGIRSATFNLGVLQGLCKYNLLKFIDYMSTVSGGGYIGSCLSSLLDNPEASVQKEKFPFRFERSKQDASSGQRGDEHKEVKHLRKYGNYLAPDRSPLSPDVWRMVGLFLTGLVLTNLFPLALLLIFLKMVTIIGDNGPFFDGLAKGVLAFFFFSLVVMVFVRFWGGVKNLLYPQRRKLGIALGWLTLFSATLLTVYAVIMFTTHGVDVLPEFVDFIKDFLKNNEEFLGGSFVLSLLGLLTNIFQTNSSSLRFIRAIIFRIAWVILLPIGYLLLAHFALNSCFIQDDILFYPVVLLAIAISLLVNTNRVSLHHFYRDRLSEAYIIKRKKMSGQQVVEEDVLSGHQLEGDTEMIVSNEPLCLSKLHEHKSGPYHLINATLNVPDSKNRYLRGRGAELFLFSREYVGAQSTGYRETKQYENGKTRLATAMAISGAAASPQMGSSTSPVLTFLLTLLNVRLNRWMPNPDPQKQAGIKLWPGFWLWYFLKEILGKGKETDRLLNLSDGGHHENLGVYPLLERRCRLIIACDAGADPNFLMTDLANLMRKARIDLGVTFTIDLTPLRPDKVTGRTPQNYAIGKINYPEGKTAVFVYMKSTLEGSEPEDILTYDRQNPDFPDEMTGDQFFDEAQFESYRELGYQITSKVFKNAGDWFEDLYQKSV